MKNDPNEFNDWDCDPADNAAVLDILAGACPNCGSGPVLIDGDGAERGARFWAFCDPCLFMCCHASTPAGVYEAWHALKRGQPVA
jgi:hypothetical protein